MKKPKTSTFEAVNPVFSFEGDKVVFKDGRVCVGFALTPVEMESWEFADYQAINSALIGALKTLPAGSLLQKTDIYYDRAYKHDYKQMAYFEGKINKHFEERLVLFHKSYLFISFAPGAKKKPARTNGLNALVNRAGEATIKNPFAGLPEVLQQADKSADELASALAGLGGLEIHRLKEREIRNLYLQYFNLSFDEQPTGFQREISNELGALSVGENRVSAVSMVGQGSEAAVAVQNGYKVTAPMTYPLTNYLNFPHILTQCMLVEDTREELKALDSDKTLSKALIKIGGQDSEQRMAEIDEFTAEVRVGHKQIVHLHLSVLVWDANDDARKKNVGRTITAFRQMMGAEAVVESFLTLPVYFGVLPGCAYQIPDRWFRTTSDRAACHMNWVTTYRAEPVGEYFVDRFRNLTKINLFNTDLENQNALLVGPSGSGKSYTFGSIIIQRFERGARQIIIDIGGSYRNVCQSLNGADFENTYFEYDPQAPIEFNPFLLPRNAVTGQWEYADEKKNFHLALLGALWKGGSTGGKAALDKSEGAILGRFLKGYYDSLNHSSKLNQRDEAYPCMQGFYDYVYAFHNDMVRPANESDGKGEERRKYAANIVYIEIDQFFLVLQDYIAGGRYEKVLNAQLDKDLSEYRLICFDLAKVKGDPNLYPVVGMLITELSLDLFRRFPDDIKYIVLDEAWALLSGTLSDFIESMYRTIRKTNGSITIITQGITEIVGSNIGPAIIANSSTKIILRHTNEGLIKGLQQPLGLTAHEMDLIRSCRDLKVAREFFIKQGSKGKVYALEAAPQLDAIMTSKAHERNYLNKLVNFYKENRTVFETDTQGNIKLDEQGNPIMKIKQITHIGPAVNQFVEEKIARRGVFAKS